MIAEILALATSAVVPEASPKLTLARQFVEAFIREPASARSLVTADAIFVSGDIGFNMADAVNPASKDSNPFDGCVVDTLTDSAEATKESVESTKATPGQTKEPPSAFDGTMHCKASGQIHNAAFRVVLIGDKVALLQLTGGD